jgi:hypothetical protein
MKRIFCPQNHSHFVVSNPWPNKKCKELDSDDQR